MSLRGGTRRPLHSGQWSPHPIPDPVIRTTAPRTTSRYAAAAAVQASVTTRLVMGGTISGGTLTRDPLRLGAQGQKIRLIFAELANPRRSMEGRRVDRVAPGVPPWH